MKRYSLYLLAVIFLSIAVISGRIADESTWENETASQAVSSGAGEIGGILADLLWLQLDRYHHIWMYQGNEWMTATDYLPQLWLIIKLDPTFAEAYIDGGNHLAINLGHPEEGLRLLAEGVRQCPDNEKMRWERLIVLWQTYYYGSRSIQEAAWDYMTLVKEKRGLIVDPWNEANAALILELCFEDDSLRFNHTEISERYGERCDFIRFASRNDLWRPIP
ncbi:hypothetical protein DRQ25_16665 [Candidatus Fermentibacteria bacterium]|nr:MAG: hypothetical protein DRQ25_16665 [Candidatus Fermentibacteria bacterium]